MNEEAIWELAATGGLSALTVERLAEKTSQSSVELRRLYPEPTYMVITVAQDLHTTAMALPVASVSVQDRLTDIVMSHLDTGLPHREAIRRLWDDLLTAPCPLVTLRPHLLKITSRILKEAGVPSTNFWYPLQVQAYFGLFLYVLRTWTRDDSAQQEQTLVALDKGLKFLENLPW